MDKELKQRIEKFKKRVGRKRAEILLLEQDLNLSLIQKLLGGSYDHQPGALQLKAIERALESK